MYYLNISAGSDIVNKWYKYGLNVVVVLGSISAAIVRSVLIAFITFTGLSTIKKALGPRAGFQ